MKLIAKIEKFGLKNITGISITLIILVLLLDLIPIIFCLDINLLSTTNTLSFIGAIFAFWYGYKKYERDKELEIIEKYTKKYALIKKENDSSLLLNLFYEEFYLKCRGFISDELWKEWDTWITLDIYNLIDSDTSEVVKGLLELKKKSKSRKISPEEISKAVTKLNTDGSYSIVKNFGYHSYENIQYNGENFIEYFISKVKELKKDHIINIKLYNEKKISMLNIDGENFILEKEIKKEYCNNILSQFESLLNDMNNINKEKCPPRQ